MTPNGLILSSKNSSQPFPVPSRSIIFSPPDQFYCYLSHLSRINSFRIVQHLPASLSVIFTVQSKWAKSFSLPCFRTDITVKRERVENMRNHHRFISIYTASAKIKIWNKYLNVAEHYWKKNLTNIYFQKGQERLKKYN